MFRHFSKILPAFFVIVGSAVVIVGSTLLKSAPRDTGRPTSPVRGTVVANFPGPIAGTTASPNILHVVILIQENHSFDNVLGLLCLQLLGGDGPTSWRCPKRSTV
jgi:phospholipase C